MCPIWWKSCIDSTGNNSSFIFINYSSVPWMLKQKEILVSINFYKLKTFSIGIYSCVLLCLENMWWFQDHEEMLGTPGQICSPGSCLPFQASVKASLHPYSLCKMNCNSFWETQGCHKSLHALMHVAGFLSSQLSVHAVGLPPNSFGLLHVVPCVCARLPNSP